MCVDPRRRFSHDAPKVRRPTLKNRPRAVLSLLFVSLACGTLVHGCSTSSQAGCESYCETFQECPDIDDDFRVISCVDYCGKIDRIAKSSKCEDTYASLIDCVTSLDNVCADNEPFDDVCEELWDAFDDCSEAFCDENEDVCELPH
jgi:hypothetical protein